MRYAPGRVLPIAAGLILSLTSIAAVGTTSVSPKDPFSGLGDAYGVTVEMLSGSPGSPEEQQQLTYVVEPGDTLSDLAIRFDSTVDAIKQANGLESDLILIGQELVIRERPTPVMAMPPVEIPEERPVDPELEPLLEQFAAQEGLDPGIVKAVAWVESSWYQGARSSTGAVGVMQLMPETVTWLEQVVFEHELNEDTSAYDNIKAGTRYLRAMLDQMGSMQLALVAYYQGPAITQQRIVYFETQRYVDAVLAIKAAFWA